jgi:hypothetical protein
MHGAALRYQGEIDRAKKAIGQASLMANTLADVTGKHVKIEAGQ